ncbi:sugar ABC transporter ATP-binding protein [Ancylobacter pratisalsi]|uniref:Sugar ABC transporter ATP-binding protein n=1 Tax=Ancylobacter pratisalsi TaxID=1745854 RepID=A0A6P1YRA5_9HYPH|nr:sugar ABC transporter ATP-binding protein [Ancylobacter pratisalsi]QIB34583.1 sugar ABC transporter ATP-binding protein [Ancylobacter pratisalsi]
MTDTQPLLDVRGLTKRFFGSLALDNAAFSLARGEIHALVGENGAGKSTFIKILAGVYDADEGEILLEGARVDPRSQSLPLAFVHQDLALVDDLSVCENIALVAGYPRKAGLIDWRAVMRQTSAIYETMRIPPVDPNRLVATLSTPEKAILNIVRTLAHTPKVLVLDEPTAALPEQDAHRLFDAMRRMRDQGASIIYVSHRLHELFGLADRITVFRDGRRVHTAAMNEITGSEIVEQMLGRAVDLAHRAHAPVRDEEPVLKVEGLVVDRRGPLDFTLRPGEVLGLVGLRGGGQEAVGRTLFGAKRAEAGTITLAGRTLDHQDSIGGRIKAGIVLLAGDRTSESTFPAMSLIENLFPNPLIRGRSAFELVSPAAERRAAKERLDRFDVRPRNEGAMIDWLSGGNQQKVCLARWLEADGKVAILEEPTAGVDIGAKIAIHRMLREAAAAGRAILVISSDLEEVATLCDRALVIDRGRAAGELVGERLTIDGLIALSTLGAPTAAAPEHQAPKGADAPHLGG